MRERDRPALEAGHNQLLMSIKMVTKDQTCELRQDDPAMALLPSDPPLPLPHHLMVRTTGDGNCLYNAVSLVLKG